MSALNINSSLRLLTLSLVLAFFVYQDRVIWNNQRNLAGVCVSQIDRCLDSSSIFSIYTVNGSSPLCASNGIKSSCFSPGSQNYVGCLQYLDIKSLYNSNPTLPEVLYQQPIIILSATGLIFGVFFMLFDYFSLSYLFGNNLCAKIIYGCARILLGRSTIPLVSAFLLLLSSKSLKTVEVVPCTSPTLCAKLSNCNLELRVVLASTDFTLKNFSMLLVVLATCLFGEGLFYIWYFVFIDIVDPVNMQLKHTASRTAMMLASWNTKISPAQTLTECPICLRHMLLPRETNSSSVSLHPSIRDRGILRSCHPDIENHSSLHSIKSMRSPGPIARNSVLVHMSKDRALSIMSMEADDINAPTARSCTSRTELGEGPRRLSAFTASHHSVILTTTRQHDESTSPRNRRHIITPSMTVATNTTMNSIVTENTPNDRSPSIRSSIIAPSAGMLSSPTKDKNQINENIIDNNKITTENEHINININQNRRNPSSMIFRIDSCDKPQGNSFHVLSESKNSSEKVTVNPLTQVPPHDALLLIPASPHTRSTPRRNLSSQTSYSDLIARRSSQKFYREILSNVNGLPGVTSLSSSQVANDQRRFLSKPSLPSSVDEEYADSSGKVSLEPTARPTTNSTRGDSLEQKATDRMNVNVIGNGPTVDSVAHTTWSNDGKLAPATAAASSVDGRHSVKSRAASVQPGDYILAQVPCGHIFHKGCIEEWGLIHDTCPVCRADLFTGQPALERTSSSDAEYDYEEEYEDEESDDDE